MMRDLFGRSAVTREAILNGSLAAQSTADAVVEAARAHQRMCNSVEAVAYGILFLVALGVAWAVRDA
jgi:hypothetical protein